MWTPVVIEGVPYKYEVNRLGQVRSLDYMNTGEVKIITPKKDKDGFMALRLHNRKYTKFIYVHRLVALTFIPNPHEYLFVRHIDYDKTNNVAENLEWATKYMIQYDPFVYGERG